MSVNEITQKIEELVFDENKVVTYKLLSSELSVHVNKAKRLLNEYITAHCAKKKNDLNVYYAVSGFQKYNGHQVHKLTVVSKDELENIKKDFSTLSSIHIYSIQKCVLDECSLYTSDCSLTKASDDLSVFSAIRHPDLKIRENKVVRNVDKEKNKSYESQASRKTEQKPLIPAKKTNSMFTSWQKKSDVKSEQKGKTVEGQTESSPSVSKNDNTATEKTNSGSPQKVSKVADKGNKNNIVNLFSKQAVKSTLKANAQNSEKPVAQNSLPCEREEEGKIRTEAKQVKPSSKSKEIVQKKRQKHQRSHDSSENESGDEWKKPKKKKHKRIVSAFSDSDSSEEEEKKDRAWRNLIDSRSPCKMQSNGSEEDEEEPIPPTPPVPATNAKRKKLKVVSKMFEDEDGFLVTQKVKEYVTDSEGSDTGAAVHVKAAPQVFSKSDIKQNFVNKKQASLTCFFKQK